MEIFKGIYGLLEYLYDRNSADVLDGFFVHGFKGCHIAFHEVSIVAAHHLL